MRLPRALRGATCRWPLPRVLPEAHFFHVKYSQIFLAKLLGPNILAKVARKLPQALHFTLLTNSGHVTATSLPRHRLGLAEASLIDSRQWIGSMEVGWLLSSFVDAECRFVELAQGSDMAQQAHALAEHFSTQGTPVLCAGGKPLLDNATRPFLVTAA